jgi:hypothetical protein
MFTEPISKPKEILAQGLILPTEKDRKIFCNLSKFSVFADGRIKPR